MKHIKNILYVIGVLIALGALLVISTGIVQLGMEAIAQDIGGALKEELLYHVSGGLGTAITGIICAAYVKRKKYTIYVEVRKPFRIKACVYYGALAWCIGSVLFYAITTFVFAYVFAMTEETNVVMEERGASILLVDVLFSVMVAPIAEELLFRMGLYNLLRRRLGKWSAILLCTVIFAAMHGYALQGFCMCIVGGLLFLLIYVRTGNIWYSIVAHMVCNLDTTIMNALEDRGVTLLGIPIQYEVNGFNMVHPILIVAATIFCGACIIRTWKNALESKNCAKTKSNMVKSIYEQA